MRWMLGLWVWAGAATISATAPTDVRSDVNYRWASEFHHGITYDSIRSADGAELTLYCGAANMGESGLMFDAKGVSLKGSHLFQFVIDGKNYPFEIEDAMVRFPKITEDTPMSITKPNYSFNEIIRNLLKSKLSYFVIEVPDKRRSWRFSLLNIQDTSLSRDKEVYCK
jgi:hypothetical protein